MSQGESGTFNPQALQGVIEAVRNTVNHNHILGTLTTSAEGAKFRKEYVDLLSINSVGLSESHLHNKPGIQYA